MTLTRSTRISPNKYTGRTGSIKYIVIHTTESNETNTGAEANAAYFAKSSTKASAHWVVDNDSAVRCVADSDTAWAAPGANSTGLQMELVGRASQGSSGWADAYSKALLENAAVLCAEWVKKYSIPAKHLTVAELKAGNVKGFIGHVDATNAFHESTHTDPGATFPWASFLSRVAALAGSTAAATTTTTAAKATAAAAAKDITALQKAVGANADNVWGPDTDKRLTAVWKASTLGGKTFPYGVAYTQKVVGTTADGVWGPKSVAAHDATVKKIQKALGITADGIYGEQTRKAVDAAHKASKHTV